MTTALIKLRDNQGQFIKARALLDSCSTVNLITDKLANSLRLSKFECVVNIGAVDNMNTIANHFIKANLISNYTSPTYELSFLIVPSIADTIPSDVFPRKLYKIPKGLKLADPSFHLPAPIDVLLASGTTLSAMNPGQIRLQHDNSHLIFQKTSFGWVAAGGFNRLSCSSPASCKIVKLDRFLKKFWIIEDFDHEPLRSRDEVFCEEHYATHTTRDASGRYVVRLPFRDSKFNLGSSKQQALRRLHSLENKLGKDHHLKAEYYKAMNEYITLGHMTLCEEDPGDWYYIPHQAVVKESSETTKVRPVYDASSKTSTGISLNDVLRVGPTIQDSIFEQVLRFRTNKFVVTADIEKMYRQVLVHPENRKYQKILWYYEGKIRTFILNTVIFGMACAPILVIRTLHQLARDEAENFPNASQILMRDFYVDDLVSGADSLEAILSIRDEMIQLLSRGGFVIRQWSSNHISALENIDREIFSLDCGVKVSPLQKTLGIHWNSNIDKFCYTVSSIDLNILYTKRHLLSEISKIYDPLGLLGPVILYAKVLMQDCWKSQITWDVALPQDISSKWRVLAEQLPALREYLIPRFIRAEGAVKSEIHGFCDACAHGYGACLYLKSVVFPWGSIHPTHLQ
ncbi:uncharacterized protein LOC131671918 [Phymastichus coffea]|uniref:uncharacterized protein LOC131671918 n=1 Tax=Phymastichus coffea TaxID=108790 RepID=UPI00273CC857|nr:uncharacterized protein LOC131671918 [Phymastichus coffea]